MAKILFVCSGNTCRSPMAEALFKEHAKVQGTTGITVLSAGLGADGQPASPEAVETMRRQGIDLTGHVSRRVRPEYMQAADVVLAMTGAHKAALRAFFPAAADKIFTIGEYAGSGGDVIDPFGQGLPAYQACAGQLAGLIDKVWQRITDGSRK